MQIVFEVFKTKEAARYLGFSYKTLEAWRSKDKGPEFLRLENNHIRYERSALDEWLHGGSPKAAA